MPRIALLLLTGLAAALTLAVVRAPSPATPLVDLRPRKSVDRFGDALPPGAAARLGTTRYRTGYPNHPEFVAISPDGKTAAVASIYGEVDGGAIRLFELATGKTVRDLPYDGPGAVVAAFSPDGRTLAVGERRAVRVLAVADGQELARFTTLEDGWPRSLGFTPDGKTLVADLYGVRAWDLATGKERWRRDFGGAVSPDARFLASIVRPKKAGDAWILNLHEAESGKVLHRFAVGRTEIKAVVFSADGKTVAALTEYDQALHDSPEGRNILDSKDEKAIDRLINGTAVVWETATGKERQRFTAGGSLLALTSDGSLAAVENRRLNGFRVRNLSTGEEVETPDGVPREFVSLGTDQQCAFTPDGKMLVGTGPDRTLRLWDARSARPLGDRPGHTAAPRCLAFSANGQMVASLAGEWPDRPVRLWDAASNREVGQLPGLHLMEVGREEGIRNEVRHFAFAPDGKRIATSGGGVIAVWEVGSGARVWLQETPIAPRERGADRRKYPRPYSVHCTAFSPDGKLLATGTDGGTVLRDADTGKIVKKFEGVAHHVAFSADGKRLAASDRGRFRLWAVASGELLEQESHFRAGDDPEIGYCPTEAFSADGRTVALGSQDGWVCVRDLAGGKEVFRVEAWPKGYIGALALSPDGRTVAVGVEGHAVALWDVTTGREMARLTGHGGGISALAFSADGKTLASGSADTTILLWDLDAVEKTKP